MNSEINNTNLDSKYKNLGGFLFYLVQMLERLEPENRSILPHLTVQQSIFTTSSSIFKLAAHD